MDDIQQLVRHLVTLIATSAEKQATGVVLGTALKLKYPHFRPQDHGSFNLRKFIEDHAAGQIRVCGRAGLDVIYTTTGEPTSKEESASSDVESNIAQPAEIAPQASPMSAATIFSATSSAEVAVPSPQKSISHITFPREVWVTFSSATPTNALLVQRATGEMKVESLSRANTLVDAGWTRVRPLSRQDHIEMAQEFLATLSPQIRAEVSCLVGLSGKWWTSFYEKLETLSHDQAIKWKAFHNLRTKQKLISALQSVGVSPQKAATKITPKTVVPIQAERFSGVQRQSQDVFSLRSSSRDKSMLRSISALLSELGGLLGNISEQ